MLELTDEQWKDRLTPEQYAVLRQRGTEAPFSGELLENADKGLYVCGACGEVLFESNTKFDSHCGWPSFYQPINKNAVHLTEDTSHGMRRVEVACGNCGSHLGHVFNDAPDQPTGMRFCINSVSLGFDKEH
ncbi:MAG: peptide-methionine (R)-S-oxide reductase MsrB [Candidatus Saccharimonadales bacterium]